jgi:multiple sugar transport system substrate-binding protein/lactose/L-arabinose transport system substrate-binding protein
MFTIEYGWSVTMSKHRSLRRRRILRYAGTAGAAGLAGCIGTGPGDDTETPTGGSSMGDEVTGWAWDVAAKSLDLTDEPYEDQVGGGVDVKIEQIGHSSLVDKFRTSLVSGSGAPDFSILESVVARSFIDTGGLADLSGRIDSSTKSEFVSGKWEAISQGDEVYAIPWDIGPVGVFYRSDTYSEHDIDPSSIETWDQFIEEGKKLPDDVYMNNMPPNDYDGVWRMQFRQLGGKPFTEDGKVNIHNDTSVRVAQNIKTMVEEGISNNVESWGSEWFELYGNGDIASLPAGAWMEGTLKDSLPDTSGSWGVYELPAYESGGNHATNWGGSNLCLPSQTDSAHADRAWDYMEWAMTSSEMQNDIYSEFGIFPAYEPAYESDIYDAEVEFFGGQKIRQIFAELASDVPGYRYTVDTPAVTDAMNKYLSQMVAGDVSPSEAVQKAAEQVANNTDRELA